MNPFAGIVVESVSKDYAGPAGVVHALDSITLDVPAGGSLAITGPSGCGKSTLLSLIAAELDERFERAKAEGDLSAEADAKVLARLVMTLVHGIAVQAVSGAAAEELNRAAAVAVRCWDQLARSSGHV